MLCSIDGGKNKNIFSTPTRTEKGNRKEKYFMVASLTLWTRKKEGRSSETSVSKAVKRKTSNKNTLLLEIIFLIIPGLPFIKTSVINKRKYFFYKPQETLTIFLQVWSCLVMRKTIIHLRNQMKWSY